MHARLWTLLVEQEKEPITGSVGSFSVLLKTPEQVSSRVTMHESSSLTATQNYFTFPPDLFSRNIFSDHEDCLESPINLMYKFFDCGRKLENPEQTHARRERTWKLLMESTTGASRTCYIFA